MQDLATYLKARRIDAGLSQIEVSKKLGYTSAQFVSNWERGVAKPPLEALVKIIKLYAVDGDEVVDRYIFATRKRLEKVFLGKKFERKSKSKTLNTNRG